MYGFCRLQCTRKLANLHKDVSGGDKLQNYFYSSTSLQVGRHVSLAATSIVRTYVARQSVGCHGSSELKQRALKE